MLTVNVADFRKNIFGMLKRAIRFHEPVYVRTEEGGAVILSEEDYNGLVETVYLSSAPAMKERLMEGLRTPLKECLPENEVKW